VSWYVRFGLPVESADSSTRKQTFLYDWLWGAATDRNGRSLCGNA